MSDAHQEQRLERLAARFEMAAARVTVSPSDTREVQEHLLWWGRDALLDAAAIRAALAVCRRGR